MGVIISPRPFSAAWCCGPSSSGGGDVDDWIQTSHALPKVRGLLLGSPASGPWRQDSHALTCILLRSSSFTLGVARTWSRRWCNHDPWSTSDYASNRPSWPSWTFRPSSRTSSCRTCSCSSSFYAFYWAEKHLSSPTPTPRFRGFFRGHAPFYPLCVIVQCEQCCSSADATRRWDPLSRTYPGDGYRVEGGVYGGHEKLLETVCRWRSTSVNSGSLCYSREHGPRCTAAAESLWRPRGVTGSA